MKNYFLGTYLGGNILLGSDYTKVLKSINSKALNNALDLHINNLKALKSIKSYLVGEIIIKVTDRNKNVLKQFKINL